MNELKDLTAQYAHNRALGETADYLILRCLRERVPDTLSRFHAKAAVASVTTESLQPALQPLVDVVTHRSVLGQLQAPSAPMLANLPAVDVEPVATWVGEATAIPHARAAFSPDQLLPFKYAVQLALTREVLKPGDGKSRNLVLRVATRAMVRAEDTALLSATAATADQPAGLLNGVASSGTGSPVSLQDDLAALYAAVADGRADKPVFVASGRGALWLLGSDVEAFHEAKVTGGGTVAGAPLLISPAAANLLILIDANAVAQFDGGLETDVSLSASIQMDDAPTDGAAQLVSAFQTNISVLRLIRFVSWVRLRDDAAGFLELPIGGSPA